MKKLKALGLAALVSASFACEESKPIETVIDRGTINGSQVEVVFTKVRQNSFFCYVNLTSENGSQLQMAVNNNHPGYLKFDDNRTVYLDNNCEVSYDLYHAKKTYDSMALPGEEIRPTPVPVELPSENVPLTPEAPVTEKKH